MKTTLRYNTIEALQEQPAWKAFIDAIVESCNGLYDNNLVAEVNDTAHGKDGSDVAITELKLFDKYISDNYNSLSESEKTKYADIYAAYSGTHTQYETMQAKRAVLGYLTDGMHLNIRENISLRGLLRTLSLYGCRIRNIKMSDAVLPHTFKVQGYKKDSSIFGYNTVNRTYDYETRGVKPDGAQDYPPEYATGNVEADCYEYLTDKNYEEEDTRFKYIYNVYGYNQKHPILSMSDIREVKHFYEFTKKSGKSSLFPKCIYVDVSDVVVSEDNGFSVLTNTAFKANDSRDSGVEVYSYNGDLNNFLSSNYNTELTEVCRWVYVTDNESYLYESSYILNDNDKIDLIKENNRIKYNSDEYQKLGYHNLRFSLSDASSIEILDFDKIINEGVQMKIGTKNYSQIDIHYNQELQKQYYVYRDSVYGREWVVMDGIKKYFKTPLTYLKSQLFADECTLKVQPLFLYKHKDDGTDINEVSLCANFIDTEGGIGKISYEVEKYDVTKFGYEFNVTDNVYEGREDVDANKVRGVSYGNYFYKWEQYGYSSANEKTFFYKDMFTSVNFNKAVPEDPMNCFFDGFGDVKRVNENSEDFNDNTEKKVSGTHPKLYENTFKEEYFETMYFNHFVKVYPILDESTENPCSTMKLYCDDLELVLFGNIVPYIVSYDRIGEQPESGSGETLNDIDCSIFSKITSYNKHTHLITVNNPVFFENSHKPKYVVVAYQNASPFNRIESLDITSPNIYDYKHDGNSLNGDDKTYDLVDDTKTFALKRVVGDMLTDYENSTCSLNLYAECEYGGESML